jgi:phosphoribosylanthranilate isomerase
VERAKGIKDEGKVRAFIRAAKADRSTHDAG